MLDLTVAEQLKTDDTEVEKRVDIYGFLNWIGPHEWRVSAKQVELEFWVIGTYWGHDATNPNDCRVGKFEAPQFLEGYNCRKQPRVQSDSNYLNHSSLSQKDRRQKVFKSWSKHKAWQLWQTIFSQGCLKINAKRIIQQDSYVKHFLDWRRNQHRGWLFSAKSTN